MKKLFALLAFLAWATPTLAQTPVFCPTRPPGDNTNACASTAFVIANGGGGGAGTVTSVSFTGGLISVATATTTPALTIAGTSGGIPYFSSATTWASSGALTANLPVIGGGAGIAPTVGTRSGNTTKFVTTTGTLTNGNCVQIDASGNMVDAGGACTVGGGGGTVSAGTAGQVTYYGSSGNTVVGNANLTISTATVTIGVAGSAAGILKFAGGTSGAVTLTGAAVGGAGTITLPAGTVDFSATGGTSQVVKQTSAGGIFTVARLACADLSNSNTGCSSAATSGTVTSIATTSPITGGTITVTGTIGCATCVTSAAALTNGQLIAGGGGQASAVTNLTGDVTTSGGVATTLVAGNAGNLNVGTLLAARMPALTGDITTSVGSIATTLATVNSNVGTFGSATQVAQVTVNAKGLVTAAANVTVAGGITGLANPSASVGLTAVNGSATTAMRSDGAPALSQSIIPTWTGTHTFSAATVFNGTITVTSASASAVAIGQLGATTPAFQVDTSTSASITGVQIKSAATTGGVDFTAIGETNVDLRINAAGNGQTLIAATSTGSVSIGNGSATVLTLSPVQTRVMGSASVALTFKNDNLSGFGNRNATIFDFSAWANNAEVMRWTQTQITTFSTLSAQSTFNSNVTRTIASAASPSWADVQVVSTTTTWSGSTNITNLIAKVQIDAPVLTASASAISIAAASTVYIAGNPTTDGSGGFTPTITNAWAQYIAGGRTYSAAQTIIQPAQTIASASGAVWSDVEVSANTTTFTGTTTVNAIARVAIFSGTLAQTGAGTMTVTLAEGLYVEPPTAGTDVTITNAFAARFAGNIYLNASSYINFSGTSGTSGYGIRDNGGTIECKNSGGAWAACAASGTQGNQLFPIGQWYAIGPQLSATTYASMSITNSATESAISYPLSRSGTLKNFRLKTLQTQSGTGNMVFTVMVNGVATAITLTVVASDTAQTYADTTHTAAISAGDTFSIRCANAATAAGSTLLMNIQFD